MTAAPIATAAIALLELRGVSKRFVKSLDLGVVQHISDRVAIVYLGRVVEWGQADEIFAAPNHPYTPALLSEVGKIEAERRTFLPIKGEIPSPLDPPPGCHFHPRCAYAMPQCREAVAAVLDIAPGRRSPCFLNLQVANR
jgi:peptide/nickel transport system ATP-binding protein